MKYKWNTTGVGPIDNLGLQLQRIARNMNENQLSTRYRYLATNGRFVKFLAEEFKVRKLANINNKHVEKYAEKLIAEGKAHKYIKNELSGIRYIHNQIPNTKHNLIDGKEFNKKMGLNFTRDGRADRAWTLNEYEKFVDYATDHGRSDIADIFKITSVTGMRLDEVSTLRKSEITEALSSGKLHLTNTKGGVPRDVPLNKTSENLFKEAIKDLKGTDYVYTPARYVNSRSIHKYEKQVQKYVYNHRDKIQDKDRTTTGHNVKDDERGAITLHGLRHRYARERYAEFLGQGKSNYEARKEVAKELGHGRDRVTLIYLSGES
jgi:integrase